jgi:hypothetical protein
MAKLLIKNVPPRCWYIEKILTLSAASSLNSLVVFYFLINLGGAKFIRIALKNDNFGN